MASRPEQLSEITFAPALQKGQEGHLSRVLFSLIIRGDSSIRRSLSNYRAGVHKYQPLSLTLVRQTGGLGGTSFSRAGLGARGVATQRCAPLFPPGSLVRGSFRYEHCPTSTVENDAHLKKETTVRTEFGGAHDRGAFAGGLIEGKTLKGAHLNLPTFHLAGNLDYFPLHLE